LEFLRSHATSRPGLPAVCRVGANDAPTSWQTLHQQVQALSEFLKPILPAGGTVLLCYPNRPEYIALFLGVLAAGDTLFPVSSDSAGPELISAARRSGAAATIVHRDMADRFNDIYSTSDGLPAVSDSAVLLSGPRWNTLSTDGPALLLQSSGTTAEPKIVRRDGRSLDAVSINMVRACGFTPDDHVLAAVPLCHSYGLEHGLLAPIDAGSCVHVCEKFELPAVLDEIQERGITMLPGVPFMFDMLARSNAARFPHLRRAYSASGPLPRQTFDAFLQRFGVKISQLYGATEIGSVTFNNPDREPFDPASVGHPMDAVSVRILDVGNPDIESPLPPGEEGQVAIEASSMLSGYVDQSKVPLVGGHFLTGDLGVLSPDGALTIRGRLKLLIDVGGRKVNPAEVESVLCRHPGVGACVVIPMRISETLSRLKAVVTPARPDVEISLQELRRFAREHLSGYKVPRVFEIRKSLPTSASGKVLRRMVEAS
ncbi:MAG TPA: class I adenylate-forming enzyme family protein, partial [Tepidisphaeraceae bacterium]|nr:class I adenylate-forming enzyme family protein [Tepidisphaeraceae bacterium]